MNFVCSADEFVCSARPGSETRRPGSDGHRDRQPCHRNEPAWTIPGGKAEDSDQALDEAAARELREETGLVVAPADLRLVHTIQVREGWDGQGPFLLHVFAGTRWTGVLTSRWPG